MTEITFITGNSIKLSLAQKVFKQYQVAIIADKIEVPEIQAFTTEEVIKYSAKYAANLLNKPVIINDVGQFIPALNGFPGPFIKYINTWLTAKDILNLMSEKSDRRIIVRDIMAYCEPNREPVLFVNERVGQITHQEEGQGTFAFDSITIHEGFEKTQANYSHEQMVDYWSKNLSNYHNCAKFIAEL
jgi:XTP/dITP diphosphohydrolase